MDAPDVRPSVRHLVDRKVVKISDVPQRIPCHLDPFRAKKPPHPFLIGFPSVPERWPEFSAVQRDREPTSCAFALLSPHTLTC